MTLSNLRLPLAFDPERLKNDVEQFMSSDWTPHFNQDVYGGDWSGIALRAVKGGNLSLYPDPNAPEGYVETEMMARCRYVPEVLEAFKCELATVRFLKLSPGSEIRRHRDYGLSFEDGEIRVHIPVLTNPYVEFILDDNRIEMKAGEAWYLNVNFHHSISNAGETDRIHLVFDCVVNDWIREFFKPSIQKAG